MIRWPTANPPSGRTPIRAALPAAIIAALLAALLQGCAPPLLVAGAAAGAAGAAVVADKRAPGVVLEDQRIESRSQGAINSDRALAEGVNVSVTSYHQVVLVTGQVPDEPARRRVLDHIRNLDGVRKIHDHLEIGPPSLLRQRSRDTMTTARVKSELMGEAGVPSVHVKVVTEKDTVYLMGRVRRADAERIGAAVQRVEGVRLIVFVFEYIA